MQPQLLADRIDHQMDAGHWDAAIARLRDLVATTTEPAWRIGWLARLGRCSLATGRWTEAKRYARQAETALNGITVAVATAQDGEADARRDACLCLSVVLLNLGQVDGAEQVLRRWLAETTGVDSANPLIRLGRLLADRGDWRTASETLQAAIIQAGSDESLADEARLSLAVILEDAGRRTEARRYRVRGLRGLARRCELDDPDYLQGLNEQAVSLLHVGRARRAVPILRRAVRLAAGWERTMPDLLATLNLNLTEALRDSGAPPYRWRPLRDTTLRLTARAMGPDSMEYLQARCWATSLEKPEQALSVLQEVLADRKCIKSLPNHLKAEILSVIAMRLSELGRIPQAVDHYHQAIVLLPPDLDDREGMPPDVYAVAVNTILGLFEILSEQAAHSRSCRDQAHHWLAQARRLAGDDHQFVADIEKGEDALAEIEAEWDHAS